ncbi:MAG: hypothetical protein RLZZ427_949, partial [Pseudomonadota bacterium]
MLATTAANAGKEGLRTMVRLRDRGCRIGYRSGAMRPFHGNGRKALVWTAQNLSVACTVLCKTGRCKINGRGRNQLAGSLRPAPMGEELASSGVIFAVLWVDWLGRQDSNLRMPVPKTGALPLGDAPADGRLIAGL